MLFLPCAEPVDAWVATATPAELRRSVAHASTLERSRGADIGGSSQSRGRVKPVRERFTNRGKPLVLVTRWLGFGEAVADRIRGRGCAVIDAGLVEDTGEMVDHGLLAQEERVRDLAVAHPGGHESQHVAFARAQPGWE